MFNFKTDRKVVLAVCALALSLSIRAGETADELKKQKAALEDKVRELNTKFFKARNAISDSDEFAPLKKKVDDAITLYEAKVAADPKVIDARKVVAEALAAGKKIRNEELAASPEAAEILKQISAADDAMEDLRSQERIAQFIFGEAVRKASKDPELKRLDQGQQEASKAAAGKAADSPERKAAAAARQAFDDAAKAKAGTLPQGAEQLKILEALQAKKKAADEAHRALDKKLLDTKDAVFAKSEKAQAARAAENAAIHESNTIAGKLAIPEREAVPAARKELRAAQQAKIAADPAASAISKEILELQKQIEALNTKIRDAERAEK